MCLCVCVCLHSLRSYILLLHPIVLSVFVYNYLHTHTHKKSVQHFIPRERGREGRKKEEEREKIISGASSLVQDHQNETGALQMRYQCLWSTISPFPELVFLIVFPLLWTALKENSFPIFFGGDLFSFFPLCFQKIPVFFFFCKQPALVPHIADDLKQSLPWRKIPGGIIYKKTYKKALGGSVLSWIAVQVRES